MPVIGNKVLDDSSRTGAYKKVKRNQEQAQRKERPSEVTVRRQPLTRQEREVSSETNPTVTVTLDFHAPGFVRKSIFVVQVTFPGRTEGLISILLYAYNLDEVGLRAWN